jgi:hypothetical protein
MIKCTVETSGKPDEWISDGIIYATMELEISQSLWEWSKQKRKQRENLVNYGVLQLTILDAAGATKAVIAYPEGSWHKFHLRHEITEFEAEEVKSKSDSRS